MRSFPRTGYLPKPGGIGRERLEWKQAGCWRIGLADKKLISINKRYDGRQWSVALHQPLDNTVDGVDFTANGVLAFGVTPNSAASPGLERRVALTLGLD